jgi:3-hydroxypropanoate dehydrogenase
MLKPAESGAERGSTRAPLDQESLKRLFLEPRTHASWLPRDVPQQLLEEAWTLARLVPTSANCSPMRLVLLRTAEEKGRLLPALSGSNRRKSLEAPVVAIVAHDREFWRLLPTLFPHTDAAAWFRDSPALAAETALRNGTLQAAWYMLALRALGLDVGPMSGVNADAVNGTFFTGTTLETNFILNIGYGDLRALRPRLPRLAFSEIQAGLVPGKPPALQIERATGRASETSCPL